MTRLVRSLAAAVLPIIAVASCRDGDVSRASVAEASARVALAAAAITGQEAQLANEVTSPSYMGFDTGQYPGDAAMRAWRSGNSPYKWTGYYLPEPLPSGRRLVGQARDAHRHGLWARRHLRRPADVGTEARRAARAARQGGEEGHVVRRQGKEAPQGDAHGHEDGAAQGAAAAAGRDVHSDFVSGARGMREGVDAAERTAREGFPRGTTVFLDIERMDVLHQAMRDYYSAWVRAVLDDGRYVPGIYVHTHNANTVYNDVKSVYQSNGIDARATVLDRQVARLRRHQAPARDRPQLRRRVAGNPRRDADVERARDPDRRERRGAAVAVIGGCFGGGGIPRSGITTTADCGTSYLVPRLAYGPPEAGARLASGYRRSQRDCVYPGLRGVPRRELAPNSGRCYANPNTRYVVRSTGSGSSGSSNLLQSLDRLHRSLRRERPLGHRLHELVVAMIEIVAEVELSVAHVGRAVRDVDRDLLRQLDRLVVACPAASPARRASRPSRAPTARAPPASRRGCSRG